MLSKVFLLYHSYGGNEENTKIIGVFSSRENADFKTSELSFRPGFRDHADGFGISEYSLDQSHWNDGFSLGDR